MLSRSVRNPLVAGAGTFSVLIVATASAAIAADDTPSASPSASDSTSPSTTPTTSPPTGNIPAAQLSLRMTSPPSVGHPGGKYLMDVWVGTNKVAANDVRLTLSGVHATVVTDDATKGRTVDFATVQPGNRRQVAITVSVPSSFKSGTVTVKAHVDTNSAIAPPDVSKSFKVTPKSKSSSDSSSGSSSSDSSSGSSDSGSPSVPNNAAPAVPNGVGNPNVAPMPTSTAMLPNVAQPPGSVQDPAVANAGNTRDLHATGAEPDDLTFNKLASTQAAWLAALLVVFSLLLTQVRMGKMSIRPERFKGAHRRTRRPRAH